MSVARRDDEALLTRAFNGFQNAATTLERRHGALSLEVDRLRRQLLDANRRLEAVLDALETGVAVLSADGRTLRANRAFDRLELDRQGVDGELNGLLRGEVRGGRTTRRRCRTALGTRDLAFTVVPVDDADGTRVLTVVDVTEIRRQEEEGGRQQRLEALGRMAAELAHEVRNPLGSIRLFAATLHEDLEDRPRLRETAEQILEAGSHLESTVSNLLTFASPSNGSAREIDLAALAVDACAMISPACSLRGVRLEPPDAAACPVPADPEGLRQVLLNLLGNALAATDAGGRVSVRVLAGPGRAVLLVEDDGRGIAAEDLNRVFDPFFSRSSGGTGLGLSIVQRIVDRHGGRVALDSEAGGGTRVRVELPTSNAMQENA